MRRADRIMLFEYPSASLRPSRRAIFPRSRRDSLFERRRAVRPIHIVQIGEIARLRAWRLVPQEAPEDDGDPNNSGTTSAESFSARIRHRRRAAVDGSIAGEELTRIDLESWRSAPSTRKT